MYNQIVSVRIKTVLTGGVKACVLGTFALYLSHYQLKEKIKSDTFQLYMDLVAIWHANIFHIGI